LFYGYEYFSGANVIVKISNHPCLEAAAISYNYIDSKQPIYGYSSQLFDAVAPGQKIIQGTLVINYVFDNYLYDCIKKGITASQNPGTATENFNDAEEPLGKTYDSGINDYISDVVPSTYLGEDSEIVQPDPNDRERLENEIQAFTYKHWRSTSTNEDIAYASGVESIPDPSAMPVADTIADPLSIGGGISIQIEFGNRGEYLVLDSVHFLGRASAIQIDENVIVEEYSFFARNLRGSPVP